MVRSELERQSLLVSTTLTRSTYTRYLPRGARNQHAAPTAAHTMPTRTMWKNDMVPGSWIREEVGSGSRVRLGLGSGVGGEGGARTGVPMAECC